MHHFLLVESLVVADYSLFLGAQLANAMILHEFGIEQVFPFVEVCIDDERIGAYVTEHIWGYVVVVVSKRFDVVVGKKLCLTPSTRSRPQ